MNLFSRLAELFDAEQSETQIARAGPLTLELRYSSTDIADRIRPSFPEAEPSDLRLRVLYASSATHDFSDWIPHDAVSPLRHDGDRRFIFWHPGPQSILYAMDHSSRTGLIWCATERFPAWECTRPALPLIQAFLVASTWLPLHAAAVARQGRALLFAGPGRAGKTTTALACARAGWDFAGDDFVLVDSSRPASVSPLYASARMRADMVESFPTLAPHVLEVSDDDNDLRHELRLGRLLASGGFQGGQIAAILLPSRSGAMRPVFTPARKFDGLGVLMRTTGLFLPGWLDSMTQKFMTLIDSAPIFSVDTGMDPGAIPGALDEFLASL